MRIKNFLNEAMDVNTSDLADEIGYKQTKVKCCATCRDGDFGESKLADTVSCTNVAVRRLLKDKDIKYDDVITDVDGICIFYKAM